jgi:hypothetical protein
MLWSWVFLETHEVLESRPYGNLIIRGDKDGVKKRHTWNLLLLCNKRSERHNPANSSQRKSMCLRRDGQVKASLAANWNRVSQWTFYRPVLSAFTKRHSKNDNRFTSSANFVQLWGSWEWFSVVIVIGTVFQCGDEYGDNTSIKGSLQDGMGCIDIHPGDFRKGMCNYGTTCVGNSQESRTGDSKEGQKCIESNQRWRHRKHRIAWHADSYCTISWDMIKNSRDIMKSDNFLLCLLRWSLSQCSHTTMSRWGTRIQCLKKPNDGGESPSNKTISCLGVCWNR